MCEPEDSNYQEQIMDEKYEKPYLNEVDNNQYHLLQHHKENVKGILLKRKTVMQDNFGKLTIQPVKIHLKTESIPFHGKSYTSTH